jgi:hypothetical protein
MNSLRRIFLACLLAAGAAREAAAETGQFWRVTAWAAGDKALKVPLPPFAEVLSTDNTGQTWQQSGRMRGTVEGVRKEFAMTLCKAGWSLNKTIALGQSAARSELMIWTRRKQRILVMVWEKETGTCGFAWGEERE